MKLKGCLILLDLVLYPKDSRTTYYSKKLNLCIGQFSLCIYVSVELNKKFIKVSVANSVHSKWKKVKL